MTKRIRTTMGLLLVGLILLASPAPVRATTITVNSNLDNEISGDNLCTLREAITNANDDTDASGGDCAAGSGTDTIAFAIGAVGSSQTITLTGNLPAISAPMVLDAWTQGGVGYAGPPLIVLDGSNLTSSSNRGFRITGGGTTVRGFVIHSFDDASSSAIWLHTADGNWIMGNYIGTNATGTVTLPNTYGIWINNRGNDEPSHNNIIGTDGDGVNDAVEGNVIAGSIQEDVRVETNGNWIAGNRIGTTADGSAALPSNNTGIRFYDDDNVVGTNGDGVSDDLEGNLISGHNYGIGISNSSNHTIAGNTIGLDASGSVILGNNVNGIDCNASAVNSRDILIENNVISGNGSRGYSTFYNGCRHITITNNKFGTNISGTVALGNGAEGIIISAGDWYTITNNIISGNGTNGTAAGIGTGSGANHLTITDNAIGSDVNGTADLGNTGDGIEVQFSNNYVIRSNQVSGNGGEGVMISSSDAILVQENLIGVQTDGSSALDNDGHGVYIFGNASSSTLISNTIAYNGQHGVLIDGSITTISNTISANSIFNNTQLGIDLDLDGVTPTDQDDVDTGPNGLQNHPAVLTATNTADYTIIGGVFDSIPETTFTLEFFSNSACDPSGNGEGAVFLGSESITTLSGSGSANDTPYSVTLPVQVPQGRYLTATATGPEGTSEFSVCFGPTGPVQDTPITNLTAGNDGPQPDHNPVVLTATVSVGSNVSYQWELGDSSGLLNGQTVTHTYQAPGTYTAVVTATNSVGQESTSTEVIVNRSSSLSGRVWDDVDGDGTVGPGETPLAGETVRVDQNGRVYTATTESNGTYVLRGLRSGSYTLFAPTIGGYQTFGASVRILSMPITGAALGEWLPYRADFTGVRGRAWQDDDFDGRYDSGETLLTNHLIDVTAVNSGTSFINIPTDADGLYRIDLSSGDGDHHILSGDPPALYEGISRTLNGANENGYTANLGYLPGAIGGCVSETGGATVSGLVVTLRDGSGGTLATTTTDGDGCYLFSAGEAQDSASVHLASADGDLLVGPELQPAVYLGTPLRVDWEVTAPGSVMVGISAVDGFSVRGGQSTVSGYEVHLETEGGVVTTTTGVNGVANFESVTPGPITVTVPVNGDNIGVYPSSWSYDLPAGAAVVGQSFRLGTYGIAAECRTPPVPGQEPDGRAFPCTVDLYRFGDSDPLVSQSLNPSEQFFYQPATAGMYWIDLVPDDADALTGAFLSAFTVNQSDHFRYPYFLPDQFGPISGEVWTDVNANGTRETGEGSAIGFTIELVDAFGTVLESTATDTYGRYHLYPAGFGAYRVRIAPPDGIQPTTADVRTIQRDPGILTGNIVDFGVAFLSDGIEGRVRFSDLWRSSGSSITVQLFDVDDTTTPLDSDVTGSTGHFRFDGLLPDDYRVRVLPPHGGTPVDRLITAATSGTPYLAINLPPEGSKPTIFVYADENGNEVADPGEGLPGVAVAFDQGTCGNIVDVKETDSDGFAPADLVFPNGGCARITAGLPGGLSPARPDGIVLAPYDGSIVPLRVVGEGTLQLRPFWDRNGNGQQDTSEPLRLDDVAINAPGLTLLRTATQLFLTGPTGTYNDIWVGPIIGSSAVVMRPMPTVGVISSLTENVLPIPLGYENTLSGDVVGPNSGAVTGLIIELRDDDNTLIAATTTGIAPISQPGGRSYTPPPAATGGPAAAPFTFDDVAPGSYTVRVVNLPANLVSSPADISFDPAEIGSVRLRVNPIDSISGVVYWDNNSNSRRNNGESGTNFQDVVLVNDAGLPEQQVTPAADGTFVFTGLQDGVQYALTVPYLYDTDGNWVTESPGWFERGVLSVVHLGIGNLSPNDPNSRAVGQVYVRNGAAHDGVAGATVGYYQLQDSAGFCNAANPAILGQATTDSHGNYRLPLTYIPGGNVQYCLIVLDSPGLVQDDLTVIVDAAISQTDLEGQTTYDQAINLGHIRMRVPTTVSRSTAYAEMTRSVANWSAFRDDNLNGLWDEDEFPLPGVLVSSGASTVTNAIDGSSVIALADGEQTLTITPPAGYTSVGLETRTIWLADSDVTLPPIAFAPDERVSGVLFADKDGDGWLGSTGDEFGLGEIPITLDGPVLKTTVTTADGRFSLRNLPDGSYTVSASVPAGYIVVDTTLNVSDGFGIVRIPTQPIAHLTGALYEDWDGDGLRLDDERLATNIPLTVTVDGLGSTFPLGGSVLFWDVDPGTYTMQPWWTAADAVDVTLGANRGGGFSLPAVSPGTMRGTLWLDANSDDIRQPWESPLSGVSVTLDGAVTVPTDEHGRYIFANVGAGSHTLTADLPEELFADIPPFTMSAGRGAAVGIAARSGAKVYLPLVAR